MGIRLRRAGISSFVILEKADRLGGTWRDNSYPGAACDVPSHLYSYSFAPKADWSRKFAEQPEILGYLERCAEEHRLHAHLRFGVADEGATWDEGAGVWRVHTRGEEILARVLISACGQLGRPAIPALSGAETFAGPAFHSARWDHQVDFTGKRVAVVGTGASAIQFVPRIAENAAHVTLFQRTPPWIVE
jgi:cation diffusion facilitator CzcD-associated flavoprotein CzcO